MSITMHSSARWPCDVDWEIFELYLEGRTAKEILEHILLPTMLVTECSQRHPSSLSASHRRSSFALSPSASMSRQLDLSTAPQSTEPSPSKHSQHQHQQHHVMAASDPSDDTSLSRAASGTPCDPPPGDATGAVTTTGGSMKQSSSGQAITDDETSPSLMQRRSEQVKKQIQFSQVASKQSTAETSPSRGRGGEGEGGQDDLFMSSTANVDERDVQPPRAITPIPTISKSDQLAALEFIDEQIQLFHFYESHYLHSPYAFVSSTAPMLPLRDRIRMVDMYYDLDEGLAELWFGDRLSRIDVEDDDLVEVGLPGLSEQAVKRQWRNLKRVCKVITAAYRGRDGMFIPRDVPLVQAIQQTFVLPAESSQRYATLVFGFEHRLDSVAFEPFQVHELSTLCSAIGACWCDESQLVVSEGFSRACWRVGKLLEDSRVLSELTLSILGSDAPRLLRQIKETFDELQMKVTQHQQGGGTGGSGVTHGGGGSNVCLVDSATMQKTQQQGMVGDGPTSVSGSLSNYSIVGPASGSGATNQTTGASTASVAVVSGTSFFHNSSVVAATATAAAPPPAGGGAPPLGAAHPSAQLYSRRFVNEFHSTVKQISKMCIQFSASERIRDALERFYVKIYSPLASLGKADAAPIQPMVLSPGHTASTAAATLLGSGAASPQGLTQAPSVASVTSASVGSSPSPAVSAAGGLCSSVPDVLLSRSTSSMVINGSIAFASSLSSGNGYGDSILPELLRNTDARRYVRELCQLLNALAKCFPNLQCVSSKDHEALDAVVRDILGVLRLFAQLLLAQ